MAKKVTSAPVAPSRSLDQMDQLRWQNLRLRAEILNSEQQAFAREVLAKYFPGVTAASLTVSPDGTASVP